MVRQSSTFRHLAVLALLAVLLSALAPTVSRAVAATTAKGAPILMEMCTVAGIKLVDVSPFIGAADEQPAPPASPMAPACDYCVLATPLLVVLALLLAALAWRPAPPADRRYALAQRPLRNLRGLGSQAPPVLS
ncbi:Protein of unknown function (DUF2946) [Luteimonas sp. J16]|uniref:DUF2946 family protein n=1 Tax=Luteimonas sp. J29 TaxID=935863 RepID=UPI0005C1FBB2|nr:DUF2946 family protein [Luteimonas sp. J29]TWG92825.1 Protein of unknown function (DUF2946) [Luteimonas sp. J16]